MKLMTDMVESMQQKVRDLPPLTIAGLKDISPWCASLPVLQVPEGKARRKREKPITVSKGFGAPVVAGKGK